jgi:hypothetical protein
VALSGYFDESGVHAGAHATLIAGFVGSADAFDIAEAEWQAVLDEERPGLHFHYSKMVNSWKPFEWVDEAFRQRVFPKLASVIAAHVPDLRLAAVSHHGKWPPPVKNEPLGDRFIRTHPNAYSFCFQFMCESLNECAQKLDDIIVPVFAQHEEYSPPSLELWNLVRPTNSWGNLGPIAFDDPRGRQSLQMADMILYELYQFLRGSHFDWRSLPLLSKLWADRETIDRVTLFNSAHNERTLKRMLARGLRPWVPGGLSDTITDVELAARRAKYDRQRLLRGGPIFRGDIKSTLPNWWGRVGSLHA